jgi:hypothetical protein
MKRLVLALGLLVWAEVLIAQLTGSEFTYQGFLEASGNPANGVYDLTFELWDSPVGGASVSSVLARDDVPVSEGIFMVELDFGAEVFYDPGRYLEVVVNGQILIPRQRVTSAPFAIQTRGINVDQLRRVGIGTESPETSLHVVGPAEDEALKVEGSERGVWATADSDSGYGVTGIHYGSGLGSGLVGRSDGETGRGVWVTAAHPTGQTVAVFGVTSSPNGFGAVFSGPLGSKNHFQRPVGIGIHPQASLDVNAQSEGWGARTAKFRSASKGPLVSYIHEGPSGDWYIRSASSNGSVVLQDQGGNVGIGLDFPQYKLDVKGDVRMTDMPAGAGADVQITAGNVLVRVFSSRKYKDDIQPLDTDAFASAMLELQPVSYRYIESGIEDIGLIAEDVAELIPDLVSYDADGAPQTVKYDRAFLYLLTVVRKQVEELERRERRNKALEARVLRLEGLMEAMGPLTNGERAVAAIR